MVHEYAICYSLDPNLVQDSITEYDYYMMKVMEAQAYVTEQFIQLTFYNTKK